MGQSIQEWTKHSILEYFVPYNLVYTAPPKITQKVNTI